MRSMFYNYDNNIQNDPHKTYPENPNKYPKQLDKNLNAFKGARLLKDKKDRPLGVEVSRNSVFRLYFSFEGIVDDGTIQDLLENSIIIFDILDVHHNVLLECDVEVYALYNIASVEVIASDECNLIGGQTYKMRLHTTIDGIVYDLFSENDGILYIK